MTWFFWNMEQIWLCDFDYDCQWRLSTNICSTGNFCKYLPQCLQKYLHDCICATKWAILLQTSSSTRPINHLSINSLTMFEQLVALKCQQWLFSFFLRGFLTNGCFSPPLSLSCVLCVFRVVLSCRTFCHKFHELSSIAWVVWCVYVTLSCRVALKMTGETSEVSSDKRKPREDSCRLVVAQFHYKSSCRS